MTPAEQAIREALDDPAITDDGAASADTWWACYQVKLACTIPNLRAVLDELDRLRAKLERQRQSTDNTYARVKRLIACVAQTGQKSHQWKLRYKSQVPSLKNTIRELCDERRRLRAENETTNVDAAAWRAFDAFMSAEGAHLECNAMGWRLVRQQFIDAARGKK